MTSVRGRDLQAQRHRLRFLPKRWPRQSLLRALSSVLRHRQRKTEGGIAQDSIEASCIAQGGIAKGGIGNAKEKGGVTKEKGGDTKEKGGVRKSKGLRSELPGQQQLFPGAW